MVLSNRQCSELLMGETSLSRRFWLSCPAITSLHRGGFNVKVDSKRYDLRRLALLSCFEQIVIRYYSVLGYIPGELSFAANSSELARTRANSARIRQQFADTHTPANSAERSPEYAERSPEFGGVRSGSPEFARTPPRTGERFARKFVRRKKSQPAFAANEVRRERGSPRTRFVANYVRGERQLWRTRSPKTSRKCRL